MELSVGCQSNVDFKLWKLWLVFPYKMEMFVFASIEDFQGIFLHKTITLIMPLDWLRVTSSTMLNTRTSAGEYFIILRSQQAVFCMHHFHIRASFFSIRCELRICRGFWIRWVNNETLAGISFVIVIYSIAGSVTFVTGLLVIRCRGIVEVDVRSIWGWIRFWISNSIVIISI